MFTIRKLPQPTCSTLVISRRFCSPEDIIARANWKSEDLYIRLGLTSKPSDSQVVKKHYRILAKHLHPDNPGSPKDGGESFRQVQEAYEILVEDSKRAAYDKEGFEYIKKAQDFQFRDQNKRAGMLRFLGESVGLFMVGTIIYITVVAYHNRKRVGMTYLHHLLLFFVLMQLFPRLLVAGIFFAWESSYILSLTQLEAQAGATLVVEKLTKERKIKLNISGVDDNVWKELVLELAVDSDLLTPDAAGKTRSRVVTVFDKGTKEIVFPMPLSSESSVSYELRAFNAATQVTHLLKPFSLH